MNFTHRILGFSWQGTGKDLNAVCRIRDVESLEQSQIPLDLPYVFNWKLSDESYCPGYYDNSGQAVACPQGTQIDGKYDRCRSCDKQDGFRAAFFMGGEPNERMQNHMDKQHFIYLAHFFPDIIKVGTTVKERKYKRLIEQDALYSYIVATAPGHMIQELEAKFSIALNLTRSVRARQKSAGVFTRINTERADKFLLSQIHRLKSNPELQKYLLEEPELVDFTNNKSIYYHREGQIFSNSNPRSITGEFLGLRGRQLICKTDTGVLSYNTNNINNRLFVHTTENLSEGSIQSNPQTSLF